ncbi:hypothetical protein F0562_030159 [Nyssa sinensis]|uniref:PGG domain-containing protein n=1 Tax=Nyssa sinensis TaxID=561372 RepID=A0A5J5AZ84_9ASTE|nr:hypothetical protein F0562_030159 [Nyssa sinensis]
MERMERMLFEAAVEGSVTSLVGLLQDDPLILDRVIVNCFNETPLHVAAMLGHTDFVKEILRRKPELAREVNSRQSSPLHLASAKGYVEIVQALLSANSEMCLAGDRDGRNPLHLAAIKGQVNVLKELVKARPHAARVIVDCGETILHLCVNHNQLEALKLLVETLGSHEFVNYKDDDGNTILHLAVADKQVETIEFLLTSSAIDVNVVNANGFTAADVIAQNRRDVKDKNIIESLKSAGALLGKIESKMTTRLSCDTDYRVSSPHPLEEVREKYRKKKDWLEKTRSALMVVASLIATMAFQVVANPPGGVRPDEFEGNDNPVSRDPHQAGNSSLASMDPMSYDQIIIYNTTGFVASLSIILLLMSGLPFRRRFLIWILMVIMWVAVTAMALTYLSILTSTLPDQTTIDVSALIIIIWIGLIVFLLVAHAIRILLKMIRKLIKLVRRKRGGISTMMNRAVVSAIV